MKHLTIMDLKTMDIIVNKDVKYVDLDSYNSNNSMDVTFEDLSENNFSICLKDTVNYEITIRVAKDV